MTMITNVSNRTLKIGGQQLGPREMADVNMSAKDVREHLFGRSGLVEVNGGGAPKGKPGPKPKVDEPEPPTTDPASGEE